MNAQHCLPQRSAACLCAGLPCQPVLPDQAAHLWALTLSAVQPVPSRPGCNSSAQSDMEKCLIDLLRFSDFCKSVSGFRYHVVAVGREIPLENSSSQSSVSGMVYCYVLELLQYQQTSRGRDLSAHITKSQGLFGQVRFCVVSVCPRFTFLGQITKVSNFRQRRLELGVDSHL